MKSNQSEEEFFKKNSKENQIEIISDCRKSPYNIESEIECENKKQKYGEFSANFSIYGSTDLK